MFSLVRMSLPRVVLRSYSQRILPREIKTFRVEHGVLADRIRGNPELQLICDGGGAQHSSYHPQRIYIYNCGSDYRGNIYWASLVEYLDPKVEIKEVRVSFEGWSGPEDEYIRAGSEVVRYELHWSREEAHDRVVLFCLLGLILFLMIPVKKPEPEKSK